MSPLRVTLANRCAGEFRSIEELFASIARAFPAWVECVVASAPRGRAKLRSILANLRWACSLRDGDLIHQTGDIHYAVLGVWRRPVVLTIHDLRFIEEARGLKRVLYWWLWLYLPCLRADRVTVISEFTKDRLLALCRIAPAKVRVIPNCVAAEFVAVPKEWPGDKCDPVGRTGPGPPNYLPGGDIAITSLPHGNSRTSEAACPYRESGRGEAATPYPIQNKVRVLQVGTTDNKNLERVAEACAGVAVRLCILGNLADSQRDDLDRRGVEYETHQDLTKEQVVALYQSCDLVVFVSTYEGFGMPILEAQAVGRPVLTSDISPLREVAGGGALKVDPFDVAAIRAGLALLLTDRDLREELVRAGFENVKGYSAEAVAAQYAELYREVVGDREPRHSCRGANV